MRLYACASDNDRDLRVYICIYRAVTRTRAREIYRRCEAAVMPLSMCVLAVRARYGVGFWTFCFRVRVSGGFLNLRPAIEANCALYTSRLSVYILDLPILLQPFVHLVYSIQTKSLKFS